VATNEISLPYLFEPRSYQWPIWDAWDAGIRRFLLVWHRRAGKDKALLNFTVERMLGRVGNYYHIFPQLNQGRRVIWTGIDRAGGRYLDHFPPGLLYSPPNQAEMSITFVNPADRSKPGSTYQILGTDRNMNVLVGGNAVGLVYSEYALQNPQAWELAQPILRENGGWAAFCYTPRGKNHGYTLWSENQDNPEWYADLRTVDDTQRDAPGEDFSPVVSQADIEADKREGMSQDMVDQEYRCSFDAAIPGAYYANEFRQVDQERRITRVPYDPSYPVYTAWDIGVDDMTALWCVQFVGRQVCLIHYYENHGYASKHYADYLNNLPYEYSAHFWPHDGRQRDFSAAGVGGRAEERDAVFARLVRGEVYIIERAPVISGIDQVRAMFPRLMFDREACEKGIGCLRSYHHEWDAANRVFLPKADHDWSSHAADAIRTLAGALGRVDAIEKRAVQRLQPPVRRRRQEVQAGAGWMV